MTSDGVPPWLPVGTGFILLSWAAFSVLSGTICFGEVWEEVGTPKVYDRRKTPIAFWSLVTVIGLAALGMMTYGFVMLVSVP